VLACGGFEANAEWHARYLGSNWDLANEGADFRNYTYAKYGCLILEQPGRFAWQVFDNKVAHFLRDEYRIRQLTRVQADSLEELAGRLEGWTREAFLIRCASSMRRWRQNHHLTRISKTVAVPGACGRIRSTRRLFSGLP
jgi:hypothetical protein